jgi:hypothetical protein
MMPFKHSLPDYQEKLFLVANYLGWNVIDCLDLVILEIFQKAMERKW